MLRYTFAVGHFLCVACECYTAVLDVDVKLLRGRSEVVEKRPQDVCTYPPCILCGVVIEHGVFDLDRLICELVGFGDSCKIG